MEEKQLEIIEGASRVFKQLGIRSVSMDDMAKELRVSKKTIYVYYKNKQELVRDVLEHNLNTEDYFRDIDKTPTLAIDQLVYVTEMVTKSIADSNLTMMFDLDKYYPELAEEFFKRKTELIKSRIVANLNLGLEQDLYRNDINVELVASLYTDRIKEFRSLCQREEFEKFSFTEILVQMMEGHIRGVSNSKGIEYLESIKPKLEKIKNNGK